MTSVSAFVNQPTAARATSCEVERELLIQLPDAPASVERVALSPLDLLSMGRAVPMVWFYEQTLDVDALLAALRREERVDVERLLVDCLLYTSPSPRD